MRLAELKQLAPIDKVAELDTGKMYLIQCREGISLAMVEVVQRALEAANIKALLVSVDVMQFFETDVAGLKVFREKIDAFIASQRSPGSHGSSTAPL